MNKLKSLFAGFKKKYTESTHVRALTFFFGWISFLTFCCLCGKWFFVPLFGALFYVMAYMLADMSRHWK